VRLRTIRQSVRKRTLHETQSYFFTSHFARAARAAANRA